MHAPHCSGVVALSLYRSTAAARKTPESEIYENSHYKRGKCRCSVSPFEPYQSDNIVTHRVLARGGQHYRPNKVLADVCRRPEEMTNRSSERAIERAAQRMRGKVVYTSDTEMGEDVSNR